jgi:hypothetical protein
MIRHAVSQRGGFLRRMIAASHLVLASLNAGSMEPIRISPDGGGFVLAESPEPFRIWGVNYDHDSTGEHGRLLEDYWIDEWDTVRNDFQEIAGLGANVVRIHLQFGRFMNSQTDANPMALEQLIKLVGLAEETGLYLDLTGLGCYHKQDVPAWYDELSEDDRWEAQAAFWKAVAACPMVPPELRARFDP